MSAPNLALRNCLYVNYVGTDDAGYDTIGKPWSYASLAAALAALATQTNPPSATNPWSIAIGPGVFSTPAFQIPAWVTICGSPDAETGQNTTLQMTGNITLASNWAAGATQGGLANLVIRKTGAQVMDFTIANPTSGNPLRTVLLENITTDIPTITYQGTGTGDAINAKRFVQDGSATDVITLRNGTVRLNNFQSAADVTIGDSASGGLATAARLFGLDMQTGGALAIVATAQAVTAVLVASQVPDLALTRTAGSLSVSADSISLPIRGSIVITGTVTLTRLNDAYGEAYTPTTPGDWTVVPSTVQQALDYLAARGGGGIVWVTPPVNANDPGTAGQVAYDASYFYVCTATNTWGRIPLNSW